MDMFLNYNRVINAIISAKKMIIMTPKFDTNLGHRVFNIFTSSKDYQDTILLSK